LTTEFPRYKPLGDSGLTVVIGEGISRALSKRVMSIARALRASRIDGIREIEPAYASIGIYFDPPSTALEDLVSRIRAVVEAPLEESEESDDARTIRIPVHYDGEDLADVAERTGHSVADVVRLHSEREYYAYVVGFIPGWAYLGEIDNSLVLPRRSAPRKRVPAGSVAIAEAQTGVYPFSTPGGWHLIGRTEVKMFDPLRDEPGLVRVGDMVVFEEVK
jgi:inhibitor of KinA